MNKPKKIAVRHNTWGNWACFIGTQRVESFGEPFDAKMWLIEQLDTGLFVLSDTSYITQEDVLSFVAGLKTTKVLK